MQFSIIGIRPGEKLHEQMIGIDDAPHTYEYDEYFKVLPAINNWSIDENRINSEIGSQIFLIHRILILNELVLPNLKIG